MEYTVPLSIDSIGEPTGLFSVFTTEAPVVFIFTNHARLNDFLDAAAGAVSKDGGKVGSTSFEADSMEEFIAKLLDMDPTLQGTQLVTDSALFFEDALEMLRAVGS